MNISANSNMRIMSLHKLVLDKTVCTYPCCGPGVKMDLSVLEGKDPAGYLAEQAFRKNQSTPILSRLLLILMCLLVVTREF